MEKISLGEGAVGGGCVCEVGVGGARGVRQDFLNPVVLCCD